MTADLFSASPFPEGFRYEPDVLSEPQEAALLAELAGLAFKEFDFHGFLGKRPVVSFGWRYDFAAERVQTAEIMPGFLQAIRQSAAAALGRRPEDFEQVLVTEYGSGAGIGWHKDKAVFAEIVGVSLGAACTLRLRQRQGEKWQRVSTELAPRSVYLFSGGVRSQWEHSIPPVLQTRYSLTFRSLAGGR